MTDKDQQPESLPVHAYAVIVDGRFHDSKRFEVDAKESGFETGQRFDILPLTDIYSALARIAELEEEVKEARRKALEEAAKAADGFDYGRVYTVERAGIVGSVKSQIVAAIRSLQEAKG